MTLVLFVFIILFISMNISGFILFLLMNTGVVSPSSIGRVIPITIFLLLFSLIVGTILTLLGGERFLRPLRKLTEATKEIASGNFDVRVEAGGPHELGRLAQSFNEMAGELAGIETLRSDFISTISHEFKTPIVSIRGFARQLKKNSLTAEQRDEYLDIILSESDRLTRLSSNVLLLSRFESTEKITGQTVYDLDEQLRRTVLLLEPQLQKKQLEVNFYAESVRIRANEEMLSHLWINLLDNAVKFSPAGDVIGITLKRDGQNAVTVLSDNGPGMDVETKRRIFEKFYQGDPSRATEGNGLGLSLVKRISDLANGTITVDSEPGAGSVFTVSLPIE
ncbi:MAG: HAMP domain-containing histidine kinase [Clostridia bacterium]|nr:HAMP domain-containing histidine kinase [Clostridia bacterium]